MKSKYKFLLLFPCFVLASAALNIILMLFSVAIHEGIQYLGVEIAGYWVFIFYFILQGSLNYLAQF